MGNKKLFYDLIKERDEKINLIIEEYWLKLEPLLHKFTHKELVNCGYKKIDLHIPACWKNHKEYIYRNKEYKQLRVAYENNIITGVYDYSQGELITIVDLDHLKEFTEL